MKHRMRIMSEKLRLGPVAILGAGYAGDADIKSVEVSVDEGKTWRLATFIGPHEPFAWRQWQYVWEVKEKGTYRIMARADDSGGGVQPMSASWNVLGYGNNGIEEHAVTFQIT